MNTLPGRGIRAGIIGTGFMGSVHADAVRAAGGTVTAVAGRTRYARLPAGHPQGYQDAFNAFVGSTYGAVRGDAVEGLPIFDAGARASRLVEAVLRSSSTDAWVSVDDHTTEQLHEEGRH